MNMHFNSIFWSIHYSILPEYELVFTLQSSQTLILKVIPYSRVWSAYDLQLPCLLHMNVLSCHAPCIACNVLLIEMYNINTLYTNNHKYFSISIQIHVGLRYFRVSFALLASTLMPRSRSYVVVFINILVLAPYRIAL